MKNRAHALNPKKANLEMKRAVIRHAQKNPTNLKPEMENRAPSVKRETKPNMPRRIPAANREGTQTLEKETGLKIIQTRFIRLSLKNRINDTVKNQETEKRVRAQIKGQVIIDLFAGETLRPRPVSQNFHSPIK